METKLSIEESARLIELGVDPKLASKCESAMKVCASGRGIIRLPESRPIFTLSDLLSILPKEINHQCLTIVSTDKLYFAHYGKWEKEYIHSWQVEKPRQFDPAGHGRLTLLDKIILTL